MERRFATDKYDSGYASLYAARVNRPKRICEIGVGTGGSLLLWHELWPMLERLVGVDLAAPIANFHPSIVVVQGDQTDAAFLARIGQQHGPFDLVIDDASHVGGASWITYTALWPYVAAGGAYVVEDWGTGYWPSWSDGQEYLAQAPPGHISGMVGMVKRLVDEVEHNGAERLEVLPGIVFLWKESA